MKTVEVLKKKIGFIMCPSLTEALNVMRYVEEIPFISLRQGQILNIQRNGNITLLPYRFSLLLIGFLGRLPK